MSGSEENLESAIFNGTVSDPMDEDVDLTLFRSIGVQVLIGIFTTLLAFSFFGFAIYMGWTEDLTPRVANRPKKMLNNAILHHLPDFMEKTALWYPIAWIGWAYHFTYVEGLTGIPKTGTRKEGREGPLLKINLDAVILLRFQDLMFKVSMLATALCVFIILPLNVTAGCDDEQFGIGTCLQLAAEKSTFSQTTIDNIPSKIYNNNNSTSMKCNVSISSSDLVAIFNTSKSVTLDDGCDTLDDVIWIPEQTSRIMAIAVCCLILYTYTLYLVHCEWIENVTLRRKYFLETTHYSKRMAELNKLAIERSGAKKDLHDNTDDDINEAAGNDTISNSFKSNASYRFGESENIREARLRSLQYSDRPAWLPHPEIRETPPSVGIFSVLYQLPKSLVTFDTDGTKALERQLVATTNFFNEIIRPDSGFSSSVVAVTVIPNANLVFKARSKWKACEMLLLKLRLVRQRIHELKKEKEESERKDDAEELSVNVVQIPGRLTLHDGVTGYQAEEDIEVLDNSPSRKMSSAIDHTGQMSTIRSKPIEFKYEYFDTKEYASSIGFHEEVHDISGFVNGMGIEEFNVFARECVDMAGQSFMNFNMYDKYTIEDLREEEKKLRLELLNASKELEEAREKVVDFQDNVKKLDDVDPTSIQQPSARFEDELDTVQQYGAYESAVNFARSIRRRSTAINTIKLPEVGEVAAEEDDSPKRESGSAKRIKGCLACLLAFPKRAYIGKDVENYEYKERRKYYGASLPPTDGESGGSGFVTKSRNPSYAVITFTTRQAAVIARQCLADGGARNNWKQVDDIPVYPLADAPPLQFWKPVTPTIPYAQKKLRRWIIYTFITLFTIANVSLVNQIDHHIVQPILSPIDEGLGRGGSLGAVASGLLQSLLFSICPSVFKILAGIEGSSTSVEKVEQKALIFFWYFYIIARFLGVIAWDMLIKFTRAEGGAEELILDAIEALAESVPLSLGPSALTYILSTCTITWPVVYLCQAPFFSTSFLRIKWLNRILKEGGNGSKVSLSIYANNGYIFACMIALAPLCPLIAPAALLATISISPMLRFTLVFGYRPTFDAGGDKWPQIHHMIITSLLLGQFITGVTFMLKQNIIAGLIMIFCIIPTLLYNTVVLDKYRRPFQDAALLQSSRMYSHTDDSGQDTRSWLQREEYRRWLVDCHKACYLPTCMSGGKNLLTAEPAIVISTDNTDAMESIKEDEIPSSPKGRRRSSAANPEFQELQMSMRRIMTKQKAQKGGILRRQRFNI